MASHLYGDLFTSMAGSGWLATVLATSS